MRFAVGSCKLIVKAKCQLFLIQTGIKVTHPPMPVLYYFYLQPSSAKLNNTNITELSKSHIYYAQIIPDVQYWIWYFNVYAYPVYLLLLSRIRAVLEYACQSWMPGLTQQHIHYN